jgi:hypothetical protein
VNFGECAFPPIDVLTVEDAASSFLVDEPDSSRFTA